mgnify:FL=1
MIGERVQNCFELGSVDKHPVVGMVEQLAKQSEGDFKLLQVLFKNSIIIILELDNFEITAIVYFVVFCSSQ